MNFDMASIPEYIWGIIWLFSGVLLDILKLLFSTVGNETSAIVGKLHSSSNVGRVKFLGANAARIELTVINDIARIFGGIKCSLITWSNNFLNQVVKQKKNEAKPNDSSLVEENQKQTENYEDTYLVSCKNNEKSVFNNPENEYAGQQVIGALIGLLALLGFLYADAAQGAQTFSILFDGAIPPFLDSIIAPLIIASAGSALILGVFIGDMYGFTHLGLFDEAPPVGFKWVIFINLILSLLLSTFVALARMELLGTTSETLKLFVNTSQSIIILPMLITTFLLFRGITGLFVALAIILALLTIPFGFFEFLIRIFKDLLNAGIITGSWVIARITGLAIGAMELVFFLLELALKGSFSVLIFLVMSVFFIPNMLFRVILRVFGQEDFYSEFLDNMTMTDLDGVSSDSNSEK